jgi:hypothetical protein
MAWFDSVPNGFYIDLSKVRQSKPRKIPDFCCNCNKKTQDNKLESYWCVGVGVRMVYNYSILMCCNKCYGRYFTKKEEIQNEYMASSN